MITVRPLTRDEFECVRDLDVTEEGSFVYTSRDGALVERAKQWRRPPLSDERSAQLVEEWPAILAEGGTVLGALDGDRLAGVAVLVPRLTPTMAQLYYLHVSRPDRRHGLAYRLVHDIMRLAQDAGAHELYVSATPSQSAVGFYRSMGFAPVARPHPRLLAREPEDIHMSVALPPGDNIARPSTGDQPSDEESGGRG